jgi:hypothetical protein
MKKADVGCILTIEPHIVRSPSPIKHLQWNLPRKLVGTRKPYNGKHSFNDLALDRGVKWNARAEHQNVHSEATTAEGILDIEYEVALQMVRVWPRSSQEEKQLTDPLPPERGFGLPVHPEGFF